MHSKYHDERLRLLRARRISKTLLADNQFNTTRDREFHEAELQRMEEELRMLDTTEDMASRAIWTPYHTLWPTVHEIPSTS